MLHKSYEINTPKLVQHFNNLIYTPDRPKCIRISVKSSIQQTKDGQSRRIQSKCQHITTHHLSINRQKEKVGTP